MKTQTRLPASGSALASEAAFSDAVSRAAAASPGQIAMRTARTLSLAAR